MKVKVSDIKVVDRLRNLDLQKVSEIADSIKTVGLLHPIIIDGDLRLIAGWHRLEAHKLLGLDEIEADIKDMEPLKRELAEIDENLIRSELHYLDRGEHLKRRKEIYELLHPETKVGGDHKSEDFQTKRNSGGLKPSFAKDVSQKTGFTERTVQQDVQIATRLKPEVKKEIRDLDLPKQETLKLVRDAPKVEDQLAILQKIKEKKARTIKDAESQVCLEKDIEKGSKLEIKLDADFLRGRWVDELMKLGDASIEAVITQAPDEMDQADFQTLLDQSVRVLKEGGIVAIQIDPYQIPMLMKCQLPGGMIYGWCCANLMSSCKRKDYGLKSNWLPIITLTKGHRIMVGADVFVKSFESLTKAEDASLQVVTRGSKIGDTIVDPFVGLEMMTFISAAVGRKFIGISDDEKTIALAKTKLDEVKGVIATM